LVSWRRKFHLPEICENLLAQEDIAEIIIFQNESDGTMPDLPDGVEVIHSEKNEGVSGRFLAASVANNEHVYFQDDDLLVHNVAKLVDLYEHNQDDVIVANLADDNHRINGKQAGSNHWNHWRHKKPPWVELGFGSVAPKKFIDILPKWPYDSELLRRKADKIFSVYHEWTATRAGRNDLTRLLHHGKESGRDKNALWLRKDHRELTNEAVRLTQEWKRQIL